MTSLQLCNYLEVSLKSKLYKKYSQMTLPTVNAPWLQFYGGSENINNSIRTELINKVSVQRLPTT